MKNLFFSKKIARFHQKHFGWGVVSPKFVFTNYIFNGPYYKLIPNLHGGQSELTPISALAMDEVVLVILG